MTFISFNTNNKTKYKINLDLILNFKLISI